MSASFRKITPEDLLALDNSGIHEWLVQRNLLNGSSTYTDGGSTFSPAVGVAAIRQVGALLQQSTNGGRFLTIARQEPNIYNVLDYGADPTGVADSTVAIQAAITACQVANGAAFTGGDPWTCTTFSRGGKVYIPAGKYKISSTILINGAMAFEIYGDGPTSTRIIWAGTQGTPRWSNVTAYTVGAVVANHGFTFICTSAGVSGGQGPSTATNAISDSFSWPAWSAFGGYFVGDHVTNSGNIYVCTVSGTAAASGGPTGTGATITDGSVTWSYVGANTGCVWNYVGVDKFSDMVQFRSYLSCEIARMEFTSAIGTVAVLSGTTRPRAVICSYIDPNTRVLSNSALKMRDIDINWSVNNTGLPNQHDYAVLYDWGNSELNNSEGHIYDMQVNGSQIAAVYLTGSQCQENHFWRLNVSGGCNTCTVRTTNGSFSIKDSNVGTIANGTVFILGQTNNRVIIDNCVNEDAGRFLTAAGTTVAGHATIGSFGGGPWSITVKDCRIALAGVVPDGYFIVIGNRGPFQFVGNTLDGGTPRKRHPQDFHVHVEPPMALADLLQHVRLEQRDGGHRPNQPEHRGFDAFPRAG
jgi:hypothetical protein